MMQPNQNPYDFLNTSTPKKRFGPTTQKSRILFVAFGLVVLLVVLLVAFSFISKSGSASKTSLLEVAAAQTDILELTQDADTKLRDSSLQAKTTMISYTVITQNNDTKKTLAGYGVGKNLAKQIKPYQNNSYVKTLETATQNSDFETTYEKVLSDKLGVYRAKLTNAYNVTSSIKQKTELSNFYKQLELLAPSTTAKQ